MLYFPDVGLICIFARVAVVLSTSLRDAAGDTHARAMQLFTSLLLEISGQTSAFLYYFLLFKNLN